MPRSGHQWASCPGHHNDDDNDEDDEDDEDDKNDGNDEDDDDDEDDEDDENDEGDGYDKTILRFLTISETSYGRNTCNGQPKVFPHAAG